MGENRKNVGLFPNFLGDFLKTSEIFERTFGGFLLSSRYHRMRGGVVLDLFLSSLPAFPYFSPPLPVLHDASARVSFIAVTKEQE